MENIHERLLRRANELYAMRRVDPGSLPYMAPELVPRIESRQTLSLLEAVAEELGEIRDAIQK